MTYRTKMSWQTALSRAKMLGDIRHFFAQRSVTEVTTPILSHAGNTDVFIESVQAQFHTQGKVHTGHLHTSPEFAMKRLLATWQQPIYQICQVFRDGESGKRHNTEFSMLEWYRPHFSLSDLADELADLLTAVLEKPIKFQKLSYAQSFINTLGIHPFGASIDTLKDCATSHGITLDLGDDRQAWLDLLFSHLIEPDLGKDTPTLIMDYPLATAALAKSEIDSDGFMVAKRFELYMNGLEIANAYDELADSVALRQRFEQDNAQRQALNLPIMPIDERLLDACDHLPPCSGIALGLDRLLMVKERLFDINDCIAIPTPYA